jgi:hypothetical protein
MDLTFQLPPETLIEKNRNTRQVSYMLWALARHTRGISHRLRARATELIKTSQAIGEREERR